MRDALIDRELEHLRIDHDDTAVFGTQPVHQAKNHRVDGDRFARAGGAGDQQMRHAGKVDDHRIAADGLAEAQRQARLTVGVVARGEQFAQQHLLALRIGQLDADRVAPGHDRDARRDLAHGARDVVGEPDDARGLDARRGLELVERDHRARMRVDDLAAHAEIAEHAFERARVLLNRLVGELLTVARASARSGARARAVRSRPSCPWRGASKA